MLAFTFTAIILCTIGLALGQGSFTAVSPTDAVVSAGQNITVTCDSGISGVQPAATSNNNEVTIENITPPGTPAQMRTFQTSAFSRSHNGTILTCRDTDNVVIGSITVIVLYEPLITGVNDIAVIEGQQVSFTVTIDANPPVNVSAGDITVAPLPTTAIMLNQVNTNTVSVTISSVSVSDANTYAITANNSEGSDTQSFVLTVNQVSSTAMTQATTGTISESVTAMIETTISTRPVPSLTSTAAMTTTPSVSSSPTDDTVQGSGSNMKFASAVTVLFLIIVVFLF